MSKREFVDWDESDTVNIEEEKAANGCLVMAISLVVFVIIICLFFHYLLS